MPLSATFQRLAALVVALLLVGTAAAASPQSGSSSSTTPAEIGADCSIASSAMRSVSKIRGLAQRREVPCRVRNREEVESYLRATIERRVSAKSMAHEERAYKLLGLIPADFAYLEGLVALYTAQIGGYYDPEQRYYAMAAWLPQALQLPIAIHELTHALQDQHYHLAELMDEDRSDTDTLLARLALAEGDATAVMIDYSRQLRGQTALAKEKSVSGLVMQNVTGAMLTSSMTKAPSTLQALVVFPYLSGLNFVHQLLRHGGYRAVDRAFKRPPISTEEILHPQQYLRARNSYRKLDPLPLQTQDQARL